MAGDLCSHFGWLSHRLARHCSNGHVTPHLLASSELSDSCSGAQEFQKCFGLMKDPSSHQKYFTMQFLVQWKFWHVKSTSRYPQSNGKAESTVNLKAMKKLIRSAWTGKREWGQTLCMHSSSTTTSCPAAMVITMQPRSYIWSADAS